MNVEAPAALASARAERDEAVADRDSAQAVARDHLAAYEMAAKESDAARAEAERLTKERDEACEGESERACERDAARAEAEALRAGLRTMVKCWAGSWDGPAYDSTGDEQLIQLRCSSPIRMGELRRARAAAAERPAALIEETGTLRAALAECSTALARENVAFRRVEGHLTAACACAEAKLVPHAEVIAEWRAALASGPGSDAAAGNGGNGRRDG